MNNFEDLGLSPQLAKVLPELGFVLPTEIQKEAIPLLIDNDCDFIGLANTGTGKTAAFGLPLLNAIDTDKRHVQALVVAPTRELCQQIANQLVAFAKYKPQLKIAVVYGGANIVRQISDLKAGAQVVVATPGRLIDLLKRKALKLDVITNVVLDEADEMLNMGFKEDIDIILAQTPEEKNTWLFSATMPQEIRRLVKLYMQDPVEVSVHTGQMVNQNIDHQFVVIKPSDKTEALSRFIFMNPDFRGIVFCRTKIETQSLCNDLMACGVKAEALHGDLSQKQRDQVMQRFKLHQLQVLIATDVAARGIDVNNLTHVIHHSLPDDLSYYTHRSGRTARAGKKGISLALVEKKNVGKMKMLERKLKINFGETEIPNEEDILAARITNWAQSLLETGDATQPQPSNKNLLKQVLPLFEDVSKEELLERLVLNELKGIRIGKKIEKQKFGEENERRGKKDRNRSSRSNDSFGNGATLFINLGSIDGFNKNALTDFISIESSVDRQTIKKVKLFERHSFVEVDHKFTDRVIKSFKNKKYKGHRLRVNHE